MEGLGREQHYFKAGLSIDSLLKQVEDVEFWRQLNPSLHISDNPFLGRENPYDFHQEEVREYLETIKEDGFFQTGLVLPASDCKMMADAVLNVVASGFHPLFVMVYDEFWSIYPRLSRLLVPILGPEHEVIAQFWVWCVEPDESQRGWSPHRDLSYKDSLLEDGTPKVINIWVPLTDALPSNGCMYVLPTSLDSNLPSHPELEDVKNPQDIYCLQAKAGSLVVWNQYILHWGGRCSRVAPHPRISFAMYVKNKEIRGYPGCDVSFSAGLPFDHRLAFIGGEFLRYHKAFQFPEEWIHLAKKLWYRKLLSQINKEDLRQSVKLKTDLAE